MEKSERAGPLRSAASRYAGTLLSTKYETRDKPDRGGGKRTSIKERKGKRDDPGGSTKETLMR